MPQINRIRVNNIKYNFGTQFYDDFMMRFSCRNSIYDLANGGGKSVLMLLLLQNLIPNCTLDDKQPVEKLFRTAGTNTAIHSLIEWKLDACDIHDGYRYMTTGFCARKGRDNGEEKSLRDTSGIEYFNYCIFYKEFGDNDIKNLPLCTNGERITYNGLKAYLRNLEKTDLGVSVHIFERKGDYQNFISGYGLFESQWEIIRGINKTEGHVRTYFENSYKTTRKVVEDLLIEEIIEKSYNNRIRKDGSDDDGMAQTLLDIKDKLIELSGRKKEIGNYDKQIELLEGFAAELGKLKELYGEKGRAEYELVQCLSACRRVLAGKKAQLEELENRGMQLEQDYVLQSQKAASAEIEAEYVQLDELNNLINDTAAKQEALKKSRQMLADRLRLNEIAAEYREYLEYKAEHDKLRAQLEKRSMGEDEILPQLRKLAALKRVYTEKHVRELEAAIDKAQTDEKNCIEQLETARENEKKLFADLNSLKGICDELRRNESDEETERSELLERCGLMVADGIEEIRAELSDRLASSVKNISLLEKSIVRSETAKADADKELAAVKDSLERVYSDREKIMSRLEKCRETEDRLAVMTKVYGCAKNELSETMEHVLDGVAAQKFAIQNKIEEIDSYEKSITERRLPEYDSRFSAVLEYLKGRYGDDVQSGREIIESLDEKQAEEAVRAFPIMPYVVFAGESYNEISADKVISSMNTGSYIIPIIRRKEKPEEGRKIHASGDFERILTGDGWTHAYKSYEFLWNDSALNAELEKLSDEKYRLEEQLDKYDDRTRIIREDMVYVRTALQGENAETVRAQLDELEREAARLEKLQAEAGRSAENMVRSAETESKSLEKELAVKNELEERLSALTEAASINGRYNGFYKRRKQCEAELADRSRKHISELENLDILEHKYAEIRKIRENAEARLASVNEDFDKVFAPYYSEEFKDDIPADMQEGEVDAEFGALLQLANKQAGDLEDKTRLLSNYRASMDKCARNIKYGRMTLEEAGSLYEQGGFAAADMPERMELKEQISAKEKAIAGLDNTLDAQSAQKNRIEGSIEHAKRGYEEKYGNFHREHFDNPQSSILFHRNKMSEIKAEQKELKKKVKTLENDNKDALVMERDLERIVTNAGLDDSNIFSKYNMEETGGGTDLPAYEEIHKNYTRILKSEERLKNDFYNRKQKLIAELEGCNAYELAAELQNSLMFPSDAVLIETIENGLDETNRCIALERDRIGKTLSDMERIKDSFENRCVQICSNIKTELDRLPKLSKITLDDQVIPIITLSIPYIKENMYKDRMSVYINETVSVSETFSAQEDKLKYIRGRLSWKKLFSVIVSDMNSIRLCLYKREHIKDQSRYLKYEEAVGSTGQSQGIYIQFLIAIINYISSVNAMGKNPEITGKTIFIDNPFGAAKDVYIWEPIFKMLKTNHVQLIVPARGVTPAITGMFDVNYVLGQKMVSGRQQTVVVDYRSRVRTEDLDYAQIDYEQTTLEDILGR